jgi:putative Mg2+ transporter-C (MgtC) family protein
MSFDTILNFIMQLEPVEVLIKLVIICILSGFIGLERAALSKPAGFRTHVLVGISAVLTVVCGEKIAVMSGTADFSRIPAQLLSGIGFLGAGTILRDGFNVKGLTTAASLLAVTCIGLCVGAGLYISAIMATAIVYIVLTHSDVISEKVSHFNDIELRIEAINPKEAMLEIQELLDRNKIEVGQMQIEKDDEMSKQYIQICGQHRDAINKNKLLSDLLAIDKINQVVELKNDAE